MCPDMYIYTHIYIYIYIHTYIYIYINIFAFIVVKAAFDSGYTIIVSKETIIGRSFASSNLGLVLEGMEFENRLTGVGDRDI